jgi:glutamate--cysteine ligase
VTHVSSAAFAALREGIQTTSFSPESRGIPRVGAEVELLAHDEAMRFPVPLGGGSRSLVALLRRYGASNGWREHHGYGPIPRFEIPGRAVISFEPGGQIEISTVPCAGASVLARLVASIVLPLRARLADEGVRLESVGIDPLNDARSIPLQLPVERYQAMTAYFERIGPFGIRMMRQTAAIQVALDRGERPAERWRLLNDLAPYLIAVFANSPHYAGEETGHRSYRAQCWRLLDITRTGVSPASDDPAGAYTQFALAANDMLHAPNGEHRPFAARISERHDEAAWQNHLTTLFPEVRPRGHFEVRSCDAIDPLWHAVPIVVLAGLVYDERSSTEASILAAESRALLRVAGERGLRDASIARTARDLFQLALDGARRLGRVYVNEADLELCERFFDEYTARDRSPADDRVLVLQTVSKPIVILSEARDRYP